MNPDENYRLIGQLLQEIPDFDLSGYDEPLTTLQLMWLGRALVLIEDAGNLADTANANVWAQHMTALSRYENLQSILAVLYKNFARAEMKASPAMQGAFILAGNAFSAFQALSKVLRLTRNDALIVDPYLDEKVLTDYAASLPDTCHLRLLAEIGKLKPSLKPAVTSWQAQHGKDRPLEARTVTPPATLHDRLVIVDGVTVYLLTQSLNAFAVRAPATIARVDHETATLKVVAYEDMWNCASPL